MILKQFLWRWGVDIEKLSDDGSRATGVTGYWGVSWIKRLSSIFRTTGQQSGIRFF
jgi:hypothetical protein